MAKQRIKDSGEECIDYAYNFVGKVPLSIQSK